MQTPDPAMLKGMQGNNSAVVGKLSMGILGQSPNMSMPSDSFGQAYHSQASAEKATNQLKLPPMELLQLKVPQDKPDGINVGELLTERSARPGDEEITDFKAAEMMEKDDKVESDDYSDVVDETEFDVNPIKVEGADSAASFEKEPIAENIVESPDQLKLAMAAKGG